MFAVRICNVSHRLINRREYVAVFLMTCSNVAKKGASAVQIFQLALSNDLAIDLDSLRHILDHEDYLPMTKNVLSGLEHGSNCTRLAVDDEQQAMT